MNNIEITAFSDRYLKDTEDLFQEYKDIFSAKDFDEFRAYLLHYLLSHKRTSKYSNIILVTEQDQVLGLVAFDQEGLSDNYFKINWLIVKNSRQNQGLGKKLVKEAFKRIKEQDSKYAYLETSNAHHNERAKDFYKSLGFEKMGSLPNFYPHPMTRRRREDSVIYFKELN